LQKITKGLQNSVLPKFLGKPLQPRALLQNSLCLLRSDTKHLCVERRPSTSPPPACTSRPRRRPGEIPSHVSSHFPPPGLSTIIIPKSHHTTTNQNSRASKNYSLKSWRLPRESTTRREALGPAVVIEEEQNKQGIRGGNDERSRNTTTITDLFLCLYEYRYSPM
jgi:hypothetical protein